MSGTEKHNTLDSGQAWSLSDWVQYGGQRTVAAYPKLPKGADSGTTGQEQGESGWEPRGVPSLVAPKGPDVTLGKILTWASLFLG